MNADDWKGRAIFRLDGAVKRDPAVERWFDEPPHELRAVAREWFERMRACGDDVRELIHDGQPTACVGDAAFGYVDAFTAHVNVGFFRGASLRDPARLLQGNGKRMRHVKLRPDTKTDAAALRALIAFAYEDVKARLKAE
jgi:hypothetical protein